MKFSDRFLSALPTQILHLQRIARAALRHLAGPRSENVGGLVSMLGSCLFLLGGDVSSVAVSASFLVAELILTRTGHTRAGYSIGCALFSLGDALAVMTSVAQDNGAFQATLVAMAATWLIGAARAPLAWLGGRTQRPAVVAVADALQPIAGSATLVLRFPGLLAALVGGSFVGAAAVACWSAADILLGRLQSLMRSSAAD